MTITTIPSIPNVTRDPADLEKAVKALKEISQVREGRLGDTQDAFVSYRNLVDYVRNDASVVAALASDVKLKDTNDSNYLSLIWNEDDTSDRILNLLVHGATRSIDLYENLKVLDGQDIEIHASGGEKAQLAIDTQNAERTLNLSENLMVSDGYDVILQALGQANSLVLNENLTIGNGHAGTITFSATSKVLTIDETETISNYHTDARGDARYYTQTQLANQTAGSEGSKLIGFHSHTLHDHLLHLTNKGVMEGCVVSDAGTLNITWTSGMVWGSANEVTMTIVSGSGTCTNNAVNYLVADYSTSTTVLQLGTTFPTETDMVLVGIIWCQDNDIWQIENADWINLMLADIHTSLLGLQPSRVVFGMGVSEDENGDNALDVTMASGVLYLGSHHRVAVSQINTRTTALVRHFHASSAWDSEVNAEIDTAWYDNGTDKTDATAGKWFKAVFLYSDGKLHWVYPTVQYTTRAQANAGPIPATPPGLARAAKLTAIVYNTDDSDFTTTDWIDIRVGLAEAIASAPVSDHGYLDGLDDNDHAAIYYTKTEFDTWASNVVQQEMDYLDGLTSDLQTQLDARCLESEFGTAISTGLVLDGTDLKASAILQKYHAIDPSANVQSFLGADDYAAMMVLLSGEAGAAFDFNSQNLTSVGTIACGTITIADGSSLSLQEDITFTGATTVNQVKFPDNLANALSFMEGANIYQQFVTTNDSEAVYFAKNVGIGTPSPLELFHIDKVGDVRVLMYRNQVHGDNSKISSWISSGKDSTGTKTDYGIIQVYADKDDDGAEEGSFRFLTRVAGGESEVMRLTEGNLDIKLHDGATVGLKLGGTVVTVNATEMNQLATMGATTISANQWAALGGIAETLTAAELNILDGVSGVTAAELSYIGDVTGLIQAQLDLKATIASPSFTGSPLAPDHGAAATDMLVNVAYGTGAAPTANTTTIGSLYIKYVA